MSDDYDQKRDSLEEVSEFRRRIAETHTQRVERLRGERQVKQQAIRHAAILRMLPIGFISLQIVRDRYGKPSEYRFIEVNLEFEKITGLLRENIVTKALCDVLPSLAGTPLSIFNEVARSGEAQQMEFSLDPDKAVYNLHLFRPSRQALGVLFCDVTDRARETCSLENLTALYKGILQEQDTMLCRYLPDGTLTFTNQAYVRFCERPPEDLLGHGFMPYVPEEDKEIIRRKTEQLSPENPRVTYTHRMLMPDGSMRWAEWTDRALFDDHGIVTDVPVRGARRYRPAGNRPTCRN